MKLQRISIQEMKLQDVTFSYPGVAPIFNNLSLNLPQTQSLWLRSQKRSGTTTFLKILAGLLVPQSGEYFINGQNAFEMSFEEFLPYRLNIGYGFDLGGLINNKTLYENLILPLHYHQLLDPQSAKKRVEGLLADFGLTDVGRLRPFALSGSQRKLVCLLRAFVHFPEVVFLDDPITGLKDEDLGRFIEFVGTGFKSRGLKRLVFTSEGSQLADQIGATALEFSRLVFNEGAMAA